MSARTEARIDADFALLERAAADGLRCPKDSPHGPISRGTIPALIADGRVRSEVYRQNWRVVTILTGPCAGKATAPYPGGGRPYLVDGVHVERQRRRMERMATAGAAS